MVIVNTKDKRNEAWAKDKSGFGHRMLMKMGWKGEGSGLGKDEKGISTHLRGVRRPTSSSTSSKNDKGGPSLETLGIGATTDSFGDVGWGQTNQNFHSVLTSLKQVHQNNQTSDDKKLKKKKSKKSKKSSSSSTRRSKEEKTSKKELILAQNKVTAGHARKMREAKDLSNKSQEEMAAIFGVLPSTMATNNNNNNNNNSNGFYNQTIRAKQEDSSHIITSSSSDDDADSDKNKKKKKEKKSKKRKERADVDKNKEDVKRKSKKRKK